MKTQFKPGGLPLLIGSLPMEDHEGAASLVFDYTPEIPLWVQLPKYHEEGMVAQFMPGLPGLAEADGKYFIDKSARTFEQEFLSFFEEYLAVSEISEGLADSRFAFSKETGRGFEAFLRQLDRESGSPAALKGQVTGPVTFCTALRDKDDRAIFYDDQLRDAACKHLAMNAKWQAQTFAKRGAVPVIFIDEPGLAGFGTSAFITITESDVKAAIGEIVDAVHSEGGLAGVHVCANTQWDLLLKMNIDVISFDAYAYFDNFILFSRDIKNYLARGSLLAWGIVPTLEKQDIDRESADSLLEKFEQQIEKMETLSISREKLLEQVFVTPSCGTGSIDLARARKVLSMTRELSDRVRQQ